MKTIDCTSTTDWIWTKTKPIGAWEFFKKISCPDSVDTDALYAIIPNSEKEEKEKEQEEHLSSDPE